MRRGVELIEHIELNLPGLPVGLEGLTIAHLSDLHVRRPRPRYRYLAHRLAHLHADLVVFTGDYISLPGDEPAGLGVMQRLCDALKPRLGIYGVFGNHDTPKLRRMFTQLPVRWLDNACHQPENLAMRLIGFENDINQFPDTLSTLANLTTLNGTPKRMGVPGDRVDLLLSHLPTYLPTAADWGVDLMFSGHTHGGQCRLPWAGALFNSTDMPLGLSSGVLRHRHTLCVVSRGLGENLLPLRVFCPPHLPVYTLRRGPLPGDMTSHVRNILPW